MTCIANIHWLALHTHSLACIPHTCWLALHTHSLACITHTHWPCIAHICWLALHTHSHTLAGLHCTHLLACIAHTRWLALHTSALHAHLLACIAHLLFLLSPSLSLSPTHTLPPVPHQSTTHPPKPLTPFGRPAAALTRVST